MIEDPTTDVNSIPVIEKIAIADNQQLINERGNEGLGFSLSQEIFMEGGDLAYSKWAGPNELHQINWPVSTKEKSGLKMKEN